MSLIWIWRLKGKSVNIYAFCNNFKTNILQDENHHKGKVFQIPTTLQIKGLYFLRYGKKKKSLKILLYEQYAENT